MSLFLLLALCAAPAAQDAAFDPAADQFVRLRDGRMLLGRIEAHDLDGFQLALARSGGRLRLGWSDLFPGEPERMKRLFGHRVETAAPTVVAHRVLLRSGKEVVGRILRQDSAGIEIRTLESTLILPPQLIAAPPEEVVVEAASVLTPEQFYAERAPGVDAADGYAQFLFAQELEQMFALERARERYQAAGDLARASGDQPLITRVDAATKQLEVLILNQAEAAALDAVRRAMHRELFEQAEAGLAAFEADFPQPRLRGDFLELRGKLQSAREQAIVRYLARNWYARALEEVKRRALDREASMEQLLAWIEGELPALVRQRLVGELTAMDDELDATALEALWARRATQSAPRHRASYGEGTWILGEERARAGMEAAPAEAEDDGKTAAQKEMEERVQRYLKNLEAQRRAATGTAEGEATPDDWWLQASVNERAQFLLAYYAEFSGDFAVTTLEFDPCPTCGGTGVLETIETGAQGAQNRRMKCAICHGVGVRRALSFR